MFSLIVHTDAEQDLEGLWSSDAKAAATILAFLEELGGDQDLLDRLTQHDYGHRKDAAIHVSKWFEFWNKGKDLWRLKIWSLEREGRQYRVIYAYVPSRREYQILAIAPRDFDYDIHHPLSQRLLRAYQDIAG